MKNVITSEYISFGKLEYWKWFFPHSKFDPVNNDRIHLFGKFYWRISYESKRNA